MQTDAPLATVKRPACGPTRAHGSRAPSLSSGRRRRAGCQGHLVRYSPALSLLICSSVLRSPQPALAAKSPPMCGAALRKGRCRGCCNKLQVTLDHLPGARKCNKSSQHYTQHALPTHTHILSKHIGCRPACVQETWTACCAACARTGPPPPHLSPHSPDLAHARPRPTPDRGSPRCSAGTPNPPGRHESCGCCAAPRL